MDHMNMEDIRFGPVRAVGIAMPELGFRGAEVGERRKQSDTFTQKEEQAQNRWACNLREIGRETHVRTKVGCCTVEFKER